VRTIKVENTEVKDEWLQVRVNAKEKIKIKQMAKDRDMSMSKLICELVKELQD
jgi:predicted DNA-binding ribbon-helix-helix protein